MQASKNSPSDGVVPSGAASASTAMASRTLHIVATAPADNPAEGHSSIQDVHFVVAQDGTVAGQRDGNGDVNITVPVSGFWSSPNEMGGPIGGATVFAAANGYRDAIEFHVLVSPSIGIGNEVIVPMQPVVPTARNEPTVSDGSIHHLEIVALADEYLHPKRTPHPSAAAR